MSFNSIDGATTGTNRATISKVIDRWVSLTTKFYPVLVVQRALRKYVKVKLERLKENSRVANCKYIDAL